MNSHEVFIQIHQGCFAGTGAIVRLPQCQWSKPGGYGKISQCITTTKHSKAKTVCIFLGIYCIYVCGVFGDSIAQLKNKVHLNPKAMFNICSFLFWATHDLFITSYGTTNNMHLMKWVAFDFIATEVINCGFRWKVINYSVIFCLQGHLVFHFTSGASQMNFCTSFSWM